MFLLSFFRREEGYRENKRGLEGGRADIGTGGLLYHGGGGGGYSQKNRVGVCDPLPKFLTLFMTKICDFPYPIYDLSKNLTPYL